MQFLSGASFFLKGFRLILKPNIRRFTLIPFAINIILFVAVIAIGYGYTSEFILSFTDRLEQWIAQLPSWLSWLAVVANALQWIIWPLFILSGLLFLFVFFSMIANLIAAPFNGYLAEAVELHLTGEVQDPGDNKPLKDGLIAIMHELRKIAYFMLRAIPLLILFLIPVINVAAPILWLIFSSWMLAVEYLDYPMSNHRIAFKQQLARHKRQRGLSFGFGALVAFANTVPVFNFIVMPSAVAGATALFCKTNERNNDINTIKP